MKHRLQILLALFLSGPALAANDEECERLWIVKSGNMNSGASVSGLTLLQKWKANEPRCANTSVYWGRLAIIHILSNNFSAAREALSKAPTSDNAQGYVVAMARAQLIVHERLAGNAPITKADLAKFETLYANIVKQYPSWPTGYALLGGTLTTQKKHAEAIEALRIAERGNAYELAGVYRNLTVSLAGLEQYKSAMEAADKAFEHNKSVTGDPDFMYAAARSNIALGQLEDAGVALQLIAAKRPEVKGDPEFQSLVLRYREDSARIKK